jgi:chaperone modulatory protein CbpM
MENTDMIMVDEFCASHQLEISFVRTLEDHGLIEFVFVDQTLCITANDLPKLEKMTRLHRDLAINAEGIDAINHLLDHIEDMRHEIIELKNRLSFYEDEDLGIEN